MVPAVIVVIHESPDVLFKVSRKILVFEQDPALSAVSTHGTDLGKLIREDFWLIVTIME